MIENPKIGEKVWFLKFPHTGKYIRTTLESHVPRAFQGEIEFVWDEGSVSIKGYNLSRSLDCLFRNKRELIRRI